MLYEKGEYVRFKGKSAKRKADAFEVEFRDRCTRSENSFLMTRETRTEIKHSPHLEVPVPAATGSIDFLGINHRSDATRRG